MSDQPTPRAPANCHQKEENTVIDLKSRIVQVPEDVARLALRVIDSDPRRHPYGHHQWDRAEAVNALRTALASGDETGTK